MDGRIGIKTHKEVVYVVELTETELKFLKNILDDPNGYVTETGLEEKDNFLMRNELHTALSVLELEKNKLAEETVLLKDAPIQFYANPKTGEFVTAQGHMEKLQSLPQYRTIVETDDQKGTPTPEVKGR